MNKHVQKLGRACNIPRIASEHMFGEDHTLHHRMFTGVIVMSIGVMTAKFGANIQTFHIHYILDGFGYMIHGIGASPFVEYLISMIKQDKAALRAEISEEIGRAHV